MNVSVPFATKLKMSMYTSFKADLKKAVKTFSPDDRAFSLLHINLFVAKIFAYLAALDMKQYEPILLLTKLASQQSGEIPCHRA